MKSLTFSGAQTQKQGFLFTFSYTTSPYVIYERSLEGFQVKNARWVHLLFKNPVDEWYVKYIDNMGDARICVCTKFSVILFPFISSAQKRGANLGVEGLFLYGYVWDTVWKMSHVKDRGQLVSLCKPCQKFELKREETLIKIEISLEDAACNFFSLLF